MVLNTLAVLRPSSWFDWWGPKPKDEVITYDIWDSIYPYSSINSSQNSFSVMRHSGEQAEFIRNVFAKLDALIDVDFEEINYGYSSEYKHSQIEIYRTYSSNHSLWKDESSSAIGGGIQGTYRSDRQYIHWRDIYESDSFMLHEKKSIVHEIGHALGLRHPHGDGNHPDWDDNDSVMSYIDGDSDALFFTDLDIKALQEIWGIEDDLDAVDRLISSLSGFNKKSADKITNFNPATDTMEIDVDSFGIDSSATFASGKNKKAVKKKLAKQDFDFLYDEKKGGLYFNENGSDKGFGDGGIIAILKGAPELTSGNLEFI